MKKVETPGIETLYQLKNKEGFHAIDLEFARFILRLADQPEAVTLFLTAALVSYSIRENHICTDLNYYAGRYFPDYTRRFYYDRQMPVVQVKLPSLEKWVKTLSSVPHIISNGQQRTPLIMDREHRIYLHRYWHYEQHLADLIKSRSQKKYLHDTSRFQSDLSHISQRFHSNDPGCAWQLIAAFAALANGLTVISGAPGTGKTTVAAQIIALFLSWRPDLRIDVCAPTGKAAARLKEALGQELKYLNCEQKTKEQIAALDTTTIHRLLRVIYHTPYFRHNQDNPLDTDVLIVDEASMVSQPLMTKLLQALTPDCQVILLGDKDQLASVEAGAVFADICESAPLNRFSKSFCTVLRQTNPPFKELKLNSGTGPLTDCLIELKKSYRFDVHSGIGQLSGLIKVAEDPQSARQVMELIDQKAPGVVQKGLPSPAKFKDQLLRRIAGIKVELDGREYAFIDYRNQPDINTAFRIFSEFRILCSHRAAVYGVENVNQILRKYLLSEENYPQGLPLLILENDPQLRLYNGDIGLIKRDEKGVKRAFFPAREAADQFRAYIPAQLPAHEPVFAMTVHKSQGSGFLKVILILPDHDSPLLTRELIYTGITRSKQSVELWMRKDIFQQAIQRPTLRASGLKSRISPGELMG